MAEKKDKAAPETGDETVEEIINPPAIDSKYRMIILAAQRSKQLQRGAISRTDIDIRKNKSTRVAMKEFKERKVNFEILDPEKQRQ
jgi:DNA-directed RNA polymerase, omega subunit